MFIKNAVRLLLSNLKLCFKSTLFRLALTVIYFWSIWIIVNVGFRSIFLSAEFEAFTQCLKGLWQNFADMRFEAAVDLAQSGKGVWTFIVNNSAQTTAVVILVLIATYLFFAASGICSYVSAVMVHKHMSALQKTRFLAVLFENFKRAVGFELLFALIKMGYYILAIVFLCVFVIAIGEFIGMISVFIGLWVVIFLLSVFFAFTAKLRASMAMGLTMKQAFIKKCPKKENFWDAMGAYFFSTVILLYFNVTIFFATLGAGIFVSIPLSYMYFVILQLVIVYTVDNKRYFIDYDRIITPRSLRSAEEKLLNEVDL